MITLTGAATPSPIPAQAGIGLRFPHHRAVLETRPEIAWFEVHAENFFHASQMRMLENVRRDYPISLHGVGLSLGSTGGIDPEHLDRFAKLTRAIQPGLVSDHLSWSLSGDTYVPDLLPLPMTEEALAVVAANVETVQDALGRPILVENPSVYLAFRHSTLEEADFLAELARRTGCGILLDLNNLYVASCNHGTDIDRYLARLPQAALGEIHLAGHTVRDLGDGRSIRIDDHGSPVPDAVWTLYAQALNRFGALPTLIEWDTDVPDLSVLMGEAAAAQALIDHTRRARHAAVA